MKKYHFIILYLIIIGLIALVISSRDEWFSQKSGDPNKTKTASNFDECAALGFPIQESYPRRCTTPDGQTFTEEIKETVIPVLPSNPKIRVENPEANDSVTSPLTIKGEARGNWYFEASFPTALYDANNVLLAQAPAQAEGEWMTEDFVPFELLLTFPTPKTSSGKLVLKKDNPSGLPEHDEQIEIPVLFASYNSEQ